MGWSPALVVAIGSSQCITRTYANIKVITSLLCCITLPNFHLLPELTQDSYMEGETYMWKEKHTHSYACLSQPHANRGTHNAEKYAVISMK